MNVESFFGGVYSAGDKPAVLYLNFSFPPPEVPSSACDAKATPSLPTNSSPRPYDNTCSEFPSYPMCTGLKLVRVCPGDHLHNILVLNGGRLNATERACHTTPASTE